MDDSQLIKRIKSFCWRMGVLLAITFLDNLAANLGAFDLHPSLVVVISLAAAEGTKYLNTRKP